MKTCSDCSYYHHIYDEYGIDAQCGGLCRHNDKLVHGVPAMTTIHNTCSRWTAIEPEELPFTEPPEREDPAVAKERTLAHLRHERDKGKAFVALMDRFIAALEKEPDDAP